MGIRVLPRSPQALGSSARDFAYAPPSSHETLAPAGGGFVFCCLARPGQTPRAFGRGRKSASPEHSTPKHNPVKRWPAKRKPTMVRPAKRKPAMGRPRPIALQAAGWEMLVPARSWSTFPYRYGCSSGCLEWASRFCMVAAERPLCDAGERSGAERSGAAGGRSTTTDRSSNSGTGNAGSRALLEVISIPLCRPLALLESRRRYARAPSTRGQSWRSVRERI